MKKLQKTKISLKLEKFFKGDMWQLLLVVAFVFFCSWIFDKHIEAMLFIISHVVIRAFFLKQYHCSNTILCMMLSFTIVAFGIFCILPIKVSLLSAIPLAFLISMFGFVEKDREDLLKANIKTPKTMKEPELREYCNKCRIFNERQEFVVYVLIYHWTFGQIADKLGYSVETLKDWSKICKKKLKIKNWE